MNKTAQNYFEQCNIKYENLDKTDILLLSEFVSHCLQSDRNKCKFSVNKKKGLQYAIIYVKIDGQFYLAVELNLKGNIIVGEKLSIIQQQNVLDAFKRWCDIIEFNQK